MENFFGFANEPAGAYSWQHLLFVTTLVLIMIALAAFTKGKIKKASLDFVMIFGIIGALTGTYGAAQNYNAYPVLSVDNISSGITHCISGFASLYIAISGMMSLKRKNMWITFTILGAFCITAYLVNLPLGTNYMFLMSDDGTPYFLLTNLVNGNKFLYAIGVVLLFVIYISAFYLVFFLIERSKSKKALKENK